MISLSCNHNIQETEAGRQKAQVSFNYKVRPYLKHINKINKSCVKQPNKDLQKYKHQETEEILLHSHTNGPKSKTN